MRRFVNGLLIVAVLGGFVAGSSLARAGTVECEIIRNGKKETRMVATAEECTKLGGKVVEKPTKK